MKKLVLPLKKLWATTAILTNLPKVNHDPIGENSPELVTLAKTYP
jgi:hypothetical protein